MFANMPSIDVCCICLDALDADGHFGCMGEGAGVGVVRYICCSSEVAWPLVGGVWSGGCREGWMEDGLNRRCTLTVCGAIIY